MKEVDIMLEQWIHSKLIRAQLRKLIAKLIQDSYDEGWRDSRF